MFQQLGINENHVLKVEGICNGTLLQSFVSEREKLSNRFNGTIFGKKGWLQRSEKEERKDLRIWSYDQFEKYIAQYTWNDGKVPIIPFIHATNYSTARNIAQTGFASLCKLDEGFYGKGIYLTNKAKYALAYIMGASKPSIIIAYVLPGNAYPVIEFPRAEDSLLGQPILPSYDSHIVCVTSAGTPVKRPIEDFFLELVIDQEARVLPAFIISLLQIDLPSPNPEDRNTQDGDVADGAIEMNIRSHRSDEVKAEE